MLILNLQIYESLHFLYPHFNYRHRVLTSVHHFMCVPEELLFPSQINSPLPSLCPMSFCCLAFGILDDNLHFLNCISTSINIFIFLSSTVLYKNRKEKAIQLNIQIFMQMLVCRQCHALRSYFSLGFHELRWAHRIGPREGRGFHYIINASKVCVNLQHSCHVYIKTFCHLKSVVGMGAKNSMLFQQCPDY